MVRDLIFTAFEDAALRYASSTAIEEENERIDYGSLNVRANRLAHLLIGLGLEPGQVVGVGLPSGIGLVTSLLAVFKSGGVYLPLDLSLPHRRLEQMFSETKPQVLIIGQEGREQIALLTAQGLQVPWVVLLPDPAGTLENLVSELALPEGGLIGLDEVETLPEVLQWENGKYVPVVQRDISAQNPALPLPGEADNYIFYTSGSTGKGKGILGSHKSLSHYIHWHIRQWSIGPDTRISQIAPVTFDASLKDILVALCSGATLCIPKPATKQNMELLAGWLREYSVTILQTVPSLFRLLTRAIGANGLPALRQVLLSGEKLYGRDVLNWRAVNGERATLNNLYGLTETTILKSFYPIARWDWEPGDLIPIGQGISNTLLAVLNQDHICEEGEIGDVYIKSPFMTKGYLDKSLNKDLFVQNPLVREAEDLICRTGDIGRYRPDGNVEVLGRRDEQVKIHGVRVELNEIRMAMLSLPDISQVELIVSQDEEGVQEIACYYMGKERTVAQLREELSGWLSGSLLPAYFIRMEEFPLNINGKVDRKALPKPEAPNKEDAYIAPQGAIEEGLSRIWQQLLGVKRVGRDDSFFTMGGSSLKAIQVISRIYKEFEVQLTIADVFNHPTLNEQAGLIHAARKQSYAAISRVKEQPNYTLSHAQRRLWVLDQLNEGMIAYSRPNAYLLKGEPDIKALEEAFATLVDRHESLRTVFEMVDGEPRQRIKTLAASQFSIIYTDLNYAGAETAIAALLAQEAMTAFDLSKGPLLRVRLVKTGSDLYCLVVALHHIISDEWSMQVLVKEVMLLYNAYKKGGVNPLPALPIQYKDYTAWQIQELSGEQLERLQQYWFDRLSGELPLLNFPSDHPRPVTQTFEGAQLYFQWSEALSRRWQALCQERGATLFMGVIALVKTLLYRYTGQEDLIVGSPVAGREHPDLEGQIGFYINTLPLRTVLDSREGFDRLLERVKETTLGAINHQAYPFDKLVEELGLSRDLSRNPVFDIAVVMRNEQATAGQSIRSEALSLEGLEVREWPIEVISSLYDITCWFSEQAGRLSLVLEYNTALYDRQRMERMGAHLEGLLEAVLSNPSLPLHALEYLPASERQELLYTFNDTGVAYAESTLVALFEEQVLRNKHSIALICADQYWSYGELNERANQLAHYLRIEKGVSRGDLVGLLMDRSEWLLVGIWGILKAGGAYVPMDVQHPEARIEYMMADAGLKVVLTGEDIVRDWERISGYAKENPQQVNDPEDLCYMIYTSGSTGKPKGVMIRHKAVANLLDGFAKEIEVGKRDKLLAVTTPAFDISVLEMCLPLLNGAKLIMARSMDITDPDRLQSLIKQHEPTIMQATPAIWNLLIDNGWKGDAGLRILCGGEALPLALAQKLKDRSYKTWNVYGPTETTIWSTTYPIREHDEEVLIGRPIQNTRVYILDERKQCVPAGITGTLYIGGDGLARGYFNRPDLTTERFTEGPLHNGELVYNTGDLCSWTYDGQIRYIGRTDLQWKIRGYRIEMGEIEHTLMTYPGMVQSVVKGLIKEGEKYIAAYFVADHPIEVHALRTHLRKFLSEYMVPSYFIQLEKLPLNVNGKVDLKHLPDPADKARSPYIEPRNAVERKLALLWKEVLGQEKIGAGDDFFGSGGHSLKAIQLNARVYKQFSVKLELRELFMHPILSAQAEMIEKAYVESYQAISPATLQDSYPLSPAQSYIWIADRLGDLSSAYHLSVSYLLKGDLDRTALEQAFRILIERHESLRTVFELVGEEPRQKILTYAACGFKLDHEDASQEDMPEDYAAQRSMEIAIQPFDLGKGPLLRVNLIRLTEEDHLFLLVKHHIISDERSIQVLMRELLALYNACHAGLPDPLAPLTIQYKDYTHWQQLEQEAGRFSAHREYWLDKLKGNLPVLELPTDRMRKALKTYQGNHLQFRLPEAVGRQFNSLNREKEATLFMGLLAAVNILLYRYSGQEDLIIGSVSTGRARLEWEEQIGLYVNTLAFRTQIDSGKGYTQLVEQVRQTALDAYAHQDYPFDNLLEDLDLVRDMSRFPLFDIAMVLEHEQEDGNDISSPEGLDIQAHDLEVAASKFDLLFAFKEQNGAILLRLEYNTDLFDQDRIERMGNHLFNLISSVVQHPERPIKDITYLSAEERACLLYGFNNTGADWAMDKTLTTLFEEQASRIPDHIALYSERGRMSYRELNQKANQLAHRLRNDHGVQPGTLVGLMVKEGTLLPLCILGILKSGGAYLPIDPEYPKDRIDYMIDNAAIKILLTDAGSMDKIEGYSGELLVLDKEGELFTAADGGLENPIAVNTPADPAYVIYTSGSTGRPKGVLVSHGGCVNMVNNEISMFGCTPADSVLQFASPSFDASVAELFMALLSGAGLVLPERQLVKDAERLIDYMKEQEVSIAILPSAYLAAVDPESWSFLRVIITAGDVANVEQSVACSQHSLYINCYGPTEATVWATAYTVSGKDAGRLRIPIGKPIGNTAIYVLDVAGHPLPIGVDGEIYIGGAGVSLGYLKRPDMTAERFIPNPFGEGLLYKTGDAGRWLADGNIDFMGRRDRQVKIRGFRIEPGEIEEALQGYQHIRQAAVTAVKGEQEQQLAAYYVAETQVDIAELTAYLRERLPEYMLPAYLMQLDELPLNSSGKIDKGRLPAPVLQTTSRYVAPHTTMERAIAGIWGQVLGRERISVTDNFFEIGGHSLKAVRVLSLLHKELGIKIPLSEMLSAPVLSNQAAIATLAMRQDFQPIAKLSLQDSYPLSHAQRRLWLLAQMEEEGFIAYNLPASYIVRGQLDRTALENAFRILIERHESLRTVFELIEGEPRQRILTYQQTGFSIGWYDLREENDPQAVAESRAMKAAMRVFDLVTGPMLRVDVYNIGEDRYLLAFLIHHIISDERSMQVLIHEVLTLYNACHQGYGDPLPPLVIQYKDYTAWQQLQLSSDNLEWHRHYWLQKLGGELPVLEMPTDRPRPPVQTFKGDQWHFRFDTEVSRQLEAFCKAHDATLFMGIVALIKTLLFRYTGQEDLIVGSPVAGRDHPDLEDQIGFYINTLVLRDQVNGAEGFASLLQQVRNSALEAYDHQVYPFDRLVNDLNVSRDMSRSPLFDTVVVLENDADLGERNIPDMLGLEVENNQLQLPVSKVDLRFFFVQHTLEPGLGCTIDYNTDLFDLARIERMGAHLNGLASAMLADPEQPVRDVHYIPAAEEQLLVQVFNDRHSDFPTGHTLVDLFEAMVERCPDAIALIYADSQLTYRELNAKANRLAHHLRMNRLVSPNKPVGLMTGRNEWMMIGMLGILKSGGAYLPIDPEYPTERIQFMLSDAGVEYLLMETLFLMKLESYSGSLFALDIEYDALTGSIDNPALVNSPDDLAYIIYTSGSTGVPKGVMIEHKGSVNMVFSQLSVFNVGTTARVLQFASCAFDASIFEFFLAFYSGAVLVVLENNILKDTELALTYMQRLGVTVAVLPSAYLSMIEPERLHFLRLLITAGDKANTPHALQCSAFLTMYNGYGPTEYSVWASCHKVGPEDKARPRIPIGRPVLNAQIYCLDRHLQLQPIGIPGEICIAGRGIGRGYLGRPDLTKEKFIKNPYGEGMLYRSGDLGRWLEGGVLDFIGRSDGQVKIRGYRIEVGEVEQVLAAHEDVMQAVVLSRSQEEISYLIGYVTSEKRLSPAELRVYMRTQLPDYMVPSYFVQVEEIPVTTSGKVDRNRLPSPDNISLGGYIAPDGPIEVEMARLWERILIRDKISRDADFFEVGGNSLKAVQLSSRIYKQFGIQLTIAEIFSNPRLMEQAALIQSLSGHQAYSAIGRVEEQPTYALSHAQRRLWVLEQQQKGQLTYHIATTYRLEGMLDLVALGSAFDLLIERHESLRTIFELVDGEPRQRILSREESGFRVEYTDLRGGKLAEADGTLVQPAVARLVEDEMRRPFDLGVGPLLRVRVIQLAGQRWLILFSSHHIISDEWSMQVLMKELLLFYNADKGGVTQALPALPIQYKDYSAWQLNELGGAEAGSHRQYWMGRFSGELPVLDLPSDRPRPLIQSFGGGHVSFELPGEGLLSICREHGATLFMGLLALVKTLLYRYSGQEDLIIGTPVAGRDHPDLEAQIGYYLNTLALRTKVDTTSGFGDLLEAVKQTTLDAFSHQVYPFDLLIEDLKIIPAPGRSPLFDVVVILQNIQLNGSSDLVMEGVTVEMEEADLQTSKGDLRFQWVQQESSLVGNIEYNTDLYDRERIDRMIRHLGVLLELVTADVHKPLSELEYRDAAEDDRNEWFRAKIASPDQPLLHEVFEACSLRYPTAIAIEEEEEQIDYASLNARANRLAHQLIGLGLKPGQVVGVGLASGIGLVSSLLAVFKSGGVYLPLDLSLPQRRLEQMFMETRPQVLIIGQRDREQIALLKRLGLQKSQLIVFPEGALPGLDEENPGVPLAGDADSYIFYTSGSTGKGKGILGSHKSLSHYIHWHIRQWGIGQETRISQIAPVTFDASLKDILVAVCSGATLCIPKQATKQNMELLSGWLRERSVNILQTVPSLFRLLTRAIGANELPALRQVLLSGEKLYGRDVLNWRAVNGERATLNNLYGLTETTILKSCYPIDHWDWEPGDLIPIGQGISNTLVAVLNQDHVCEEGEVGDIYIKSPYVTKGYLDKSLELFIQNPLVRGHVDLVCRTGDIGRYRPDGSVEVLGRRDEQVKIHGVRVELNEIRMAMLALPDISQVELVVNQDEEGVQEVVCYYMGRERTVEQLRGELSGWLSGSLLPAYFTWMEEFPLNINGKVDRKALPKPEALSKVDSYVAPQGPIEEGLSRIWQQLLGVKRVGRVDSFFAMGGSSLKAIQVISRIYKEFEVQLTIADVFDHPTLSAQAGLIHASRKQSYKPIARVKEQPNYVLSHAQRRLWALEGKKDAQVTYNIFMRYKMNGDLDLEALNAAFATLVDRHESLRTVFELVEGEPRQRILSYEESGFVMEYRDISMAGGTAQLAERRVQELAFSPFDLQKGPLWRIELLKMADKDYLLLFSSHHIISDEWSGQVLVQEVLRLYNAYRKGDPNPLQPLPIQYKDYAAWQLKELDGAEAGGHRQYWLQQFAGELPVIDLPSDRPRPELPTFRGEQVYFEWSEALSRRWMEFCQERGVTLFMGLLGLVKALLYRYTGQRDLVIGSPVAGRDHPDLEGQIGYYLNTIALRTCLDGKDGFNRLLEQVKQTAVDAFNHQVYPFDRLIEELNPVVGAGRAPLFDVALILQNVQVGHANEGVDMEGMEVEPVMEDLKISKSDLRFQFAQQGAYLGGSIEYSTDLYDQVRIKKMIAHLEGLLEAVLKEPDRPLYELEFLDEEEKTQEYEEANLFGASISKNY